MKKCSNKNVGQKSRNTEHQLLDHYVNIEASKLIQSENHPTGNLLVRSLSLRMFVVVRSKAELPLTKSVSVDVYLE